MEKANGQENVIKILQEFAIRDQMDKLERYRVLNQEVKKGQILFVGSSLMEQFPINELLMTAEIDKIVYNRGIGGFTTTDMLEHMEEMVFDLEPSKIFINIGTNDIGSPEYCLEKLLENYEEIVRQIQERLPDAQIYMMAYYPVNETDKIPDDNMRKIMFHTRTNENIQTANEAVGKLAKRLRCNFIDVNKGLSDGRNQLKKEYTVEGIHMYANGYRVVLQNLKEFL